MFCKKEQNCSIKNTIILLKVLWIKIGRLRLVKIENAIKLNLSVKIQIKKINFKIRKYNYDFSKMKKKSNFVMIQDLYMILQIRLSY